METSNEKESIVELFSRFNPFMLSLCGAAQLNEEGAIRDLVKRREFDKHAGECALWMAANHDACAALRALLEVGVSPSVRGKDICKTLHKCCCTPLHKATSAEAVRLLVSAGADVKARGCDGVTPLIEVARNERANADAVRALLDLGANARATDTFGHGALYRAAKDAVVVMLVDAGARLGASERGELMRPRLTAEAVRALVVAGADVNHCEEDPTWFGPVGDTARTPLHVGHGEDALRALVECGADVRARTAMRRTPLHVHAEFSPVGCMGVLLAAGADVTARDVEGGTPLHAAARAGSEECTRALIDAGADVGARDSAGSTPLHEAAMRMRWQLSKGLGAARILVDAGAGLRVLNRLGQIPYDHCAHELLRPPPPPLNPTVPKSVRCPRCKIDVVA